jgi:hypothetical protein
MSSQKVNSIAAQEPALLSNMPPPLEIPPRFFVPEVTSQNDINITNQFSSSNQLSNYQLLNTNINEDYLKKVDPLINGPNNQYNNLQDSRF